MPPKAWLPVFEPGAGRQRLPGVQRAAPPIERMEIIKELRSGEFDVLVGINLLREGLDIPEVSLVAILDADKEGFLRSETSLIQTIGRAARNAHGQVIMYADEVTGSMERAIMETERRRALQLAFNEKHGIVPKTVVKEIRDVLEISSKNKVGLLLRCDGNAGNSFPTKQGKDPSSRARRRKRGSPGCVRDPRASSRVETGVSGTS